MPRLRATAPLLAAALLAAAAPARADSGEWVLSAAPLYSLVKWDQRHPSGGGVVAEVTWGLTDWLALRGTTFYTAQAAGKDEAAALPSGAISVAGAFAGVRYAVDVLRIVPFIDGGVGVLLSGGAGHAWRSDFGVEIGLGFDYLYTRRVSFGLLVRYYAFTTNVQKIPVYLYAGPRAAIHWD